MRLIASFQDFGYPLNEDYIGYIFDNPRIFAEFYLCRRVYEINLADYFLNFKDLEFIECYGGTSGYKIFGVEVHAVVQPFVVVVSKDHTIFYGLMDTVTCIEYNLHPDKAEAFYRVNKRYAKIRIALDADDYRFIDNISNNFF